MTDAKRVPDPRAEAAAEKYASNERGVDPEIEMAFLEGVSWKEANPTPQATDAKMPPREKDAPNGLPERIWFYARDNWHATLQGHRHGNPHAEDCTAYVPEEMLSQARAEAKAEAFGEVAERMNDLYKKYGGFSSFPSRGDYFQLAGEYERKAKAPVEPAKAAGSPNVAGAEK